MTKDFRHIKVYQYHAKIVPMKRVFEKDENGDIRLDERGNKMFTRTEKDDIDLFVGRAGENKSELSTELTRMILRQCQADLLENGKSIVSESW
jgi:hypothetical protein